MFKRPVPPLILFFKTIASFFKLKDKHRGIESGGSGRTLIWAEMWELFLQYPVTGVGYRAHPELLKVGSSAHNGYLAMLVDIGIVGFCAIMYLVIYGIVKLKRHLTPDMTKVNSTLFAFLVAYMILAMFEPYLINIGNPASLLFMFAILGNYANGAKS